jgi:hypothetical protein
MKRSQILWTVTLAIVLGVFSNSHASVIGFEDLLTRNNFSALGIVNTYQGYEWGYGFGSGVASRTFIDDSTGWASATVSSPALAPAPGGMGGTSYAWNWNGPQSLWIDFRTPTDLTSVALAVLSSPYINNASTVQLFGYDATSNLVDTSAVLALTSTFQTLAANFSAINYLEIRANSNLRWFSVDNVIVSESVSSVPEPATLFLVGSGLVGLGYFRRRKKVAFMTN